MGGMGGVERLALCRDHYARTAPVSGGGRVGCLADRLSAPHEPSRRSNPPSSPKMERASTQKCLPNVPAWATTSQHERANLPLDIRTDQQEMPPGRTRPDGGR